MSKFCAGSFTYPDPFTGEEAFIDKLVAKVEELKPAVLMPTHDEGIVIARHRGRFPDWLTILVEEADKLIRLSDKVSATELADKAGVPVPHVYHAGEKTGSFPIVFKTAIGNSAKGVYFPKSQEELDALIEQNKGTKVLMEEWIGGGDVCVDCLRFDGFFHASVYRAIVTKTDGGGTTTQREIIDMPELAEYARKFLDYVDYNGVCGLDFRVDPQNNRIAFIEMNARYTGGLATPIAAGFDIPALHYALATGAKVPAKVEHRIGTRTKWILGDIITAVGRLVSLKFNAKEWRKIMKFKGFDAFDDFRSDDKKAILGEFAYYFNKLVKNRKLNP